MRTSAFFVWVLAGLFLSACGGDPASEAPLRLPEKEKTWVKTEKVDKTTEEVLGNRKKTALQVAVNSEQREALLQIPTALGAVGDKAICLEQLNALDQKRTAVQSRVDYGMLLSVWRPFDRFPTTACNWTAT